MKSLRYYILRYKLFFYEEKLYFILILKLECFNFLLLFNVFYGMEINILKDCCDYLFLLKKYIYVIMLKRLFGY